MSRKLAILSVTLTFCVGISNSPFALGWQPWPILPILLFPILRTTFVHIPKNSREARVISCLSTFCVVLTIATVQAEDYPKAVLADSPLAYYRLENAAAT